MGELYFADPDNMSRRPRLDFLNGLCLLELADRCLIHAEACIACNGQRAVTCISFLMFCLVVLTWCLVMLVCSLHRLDGWFVPGRTGLRTHSRRVSAMDGVVLCMECAIIRSIFYGIYHTNFSCSLGGRMPFEEGPVRLRVSIPRFASTTKQFVFIWRFTFGPLRVCPAALFIGIDVDTFQLFL